MSSEIPLPELADTTEGEPDAWIRIGAVPERIADVVAHETRWWASQREYLQHVPGVARFLVSDGREVLVEPAEGALPGDIRAYLLAPIFTCLCFQAGMYALHASSVRFGDGVVAFVGDSGAGKSTLAAYLAKAGLAVVSDDLCLLEPAEEPRVPPRVVPVAPALKLWRNAVERLGSDAEEMQKVWSREDKFRMRLPAVQERLLLREVVFLEWTEGSAQAPEFCAISPAEAMTRLLGQTHFEYLMRATGRLKQNFELGGKILETVGVTVLRRPRDFARMEEVVERVLERLREGAVSNLGDAGAQA